MSIKMIPEIIRNLYELVDELETSFPGRKFTPDGHMVGSIGEVLASFYYGIVLSPASTAVHDGISLNGTKVQIKATQGKSIGIRSCPEHLLVLYIKRDGSFEEIYNGPGDIVWQQAGIMQNNGQRIISTSKLMNLMQSISAESRITRIAF